MRSNKPARPSPLAGPHGYSDKDTALPRESQAHSRHIQNDSLTSRVLSTPTPSSTSTTTPLQPTSHTDLLSSTRTIRHAEPTDHSPHNTAHVQLPRDGASSSNNSTMDTSSSANDEEDIDIDNYSKNQPPELMEKLKTFPLFKNAPVSFHKAIAGRLKLMTHHAQEYIVKSGEPAKAMYWILRGSVAVTSPDGEAVHAELVAGQFFGEIGILFNRPRTATVIARTKVLLGVLTADSFNAVLPDFPLVERMIRDEAQERLSMQDKRKRNGVTNILAKPSANQSIIDQESLDIRASAVATAVSSLPGPSVPPMIRSPSPTAKSSASLPADVLGSIPSNLLEHSPYLSNEVNDRQLPQVLDNVDHSIPTRDFLRSLPMFTLLPSNMIHELVLGVEPKRFEPFEYIVRKGELGRDIYFIVNGEVEVLDPKRISLATSKGNKDKKVDRILGRLGTGQYFGEMAFLQSLSHDDESKLERSADIRSVSTVDVLIVTGDQLENLYSRYPRICDEMRETATKRINKNKDDLNEFQEQDTQDSPFNKWKGFQSKSSSIYEQHQSFDNNTPTDPSPTEPTESFLPRRSVSPASTITSVSSSTHKHTAPSLKSHQSFPSMSSNNTSFSDIPDEARLKKRKRSIAHSNSVSPLDPVAPLTINLPPMNPVPPSLSTFPNSNNKTMNPPFQYMNHAKRLRLASVSGRRRSSVLSTGILPDRVFLRVFALLSLPELMKLRLICRRWRQLLYVAPGFFEVLDLKPFNTSIDDKALIQIIDFVGSRPKIIDVSNCFHITDVGFCYMVNEIGMSGSIKVIRMSSVWEVSAMAIMDVAVPSIGHHIEELDLSNCRKVRDDVIERIIGWKKKTGNGRDPSLIDSLHSSVLEDPVPGMEEFDGLSSEPSVGCSNLKRLSLGYCKHLTDRSMYHIALHASSKLESLDITRCTTITDAGFAYWAYQPFPNLKNLKMSDCTFLTDKSIVAIASSAQSLEVLDLSFCCALTDVSIEVLCLGCPDLRFLDLSFCGSAISDSTLLAISIHLRSLESLVVKGCVRVTRAGIDALLSNSMSLNYLDISQCRNAHRYRDQTPAVPINPRPNSRSAFVSTAHGQVVEIVI